MHWHCNGDIGRLETTWNTSRASEHPGMKSQDSARREVAICSGESHQDLWGSALQCVVNIESLIRIYARKVAKTFCRRSGRHLGGSDTAPGVAKRRKPQGGCEVLGSGTSSIVTSLNEASSAGGMVASVERNVASRSSMRCSISGGDRTVD